jgi:hypothetical protein
MMLSGCSLERDPPESATLGQVEVSLFYQDPVLLLPLTLEEFLSGKGARLPDESFYALRAKGLDVWVGRSKDGTVCILYEQVDAMGDAIHGAVGGSCDHSERDLQADGAVVMLTADGWPLLVLGLALDGYEQVVTSQHVRHPIENNVFVVPLGLAETPSLREHLTFEGFSLEGTRGEIHFRSLLHH